MNRDGQELDAIVIFFVALMRDVSGFSILILHSDDKPWEGGAEDYKHTGHFC